MMQIENNEACFVRLWLRLEHQRRLCELQYKRFCVRRLLKAWFGHEATDDFIWEVCTRCGQEGWNLLPPPTLSPQKHRELLKAIIEVRLQMGRNHIDLRALDRAYALAFPQSARLNESRWREGGRRGEEDEEEEEDDEEDSAPLSAEAKPDEVADLDAEASPDKDLTDIDFLDFED